VWFVSSVLSLRYHRMAVIVGHRGNRVDCIISVIVESIIEWQYSWGIEKMSWFVSSVLSLRFHGMAVLGRA
jgi:hypothetical protein